MTLVKKVILGEDIKYCMKKCTNIHNDSNVDINTLNDDKLYYITKHIGYYNKYKTSGTFIVKIDLITEELIKEVM